MEELRRVSASDLVVKGIRSKIQRGELKIGDCLPPEFELAKELGVGRSSLREGIKILTAYGVVESHQGEGTFITDRVAENFFDFMGFFPSKENYAALLELRRILEVGNLLAVYDKIQPKTMEELERYVRVFKEKHKSIAEYVEADYGFHCVLLSISHNPMIDQINKMISNMRRELLFSLFTEEQVIQEAYEEHSKILEGIRAKDSQMCMSAMYQHIASTEREIKEMIH